MKKKDHSQLITTLQAAIEADKNRDRLKLMGMSAPLESRFDIEQLIHQASDSVIQHYRQFTHLIVTTDAFSSMLASDRGGKLKPPKRNTALDAWVLKNGKNQTPGELLARLELMTAKERRKAIGQTRLPSLSTMKNAKKRTS